MLKLSSRYLQVAFWAFTLGTIFLSLVPAVFLPQAFNWWDKAQHALGFAVLTGLGLVAYPRARWRIPCGLLVLGAFIEIAQAASGWRQGDWLDLLADSVGILAAMCAWHLGLFGGGRTSPPDGD
jgi:hypothetical protein